MISFTQLYYAQREGGEAMSDKLDYKDRLFMDSFRNASTINVALSRGQVKRLMRLGHEGKRKEVKR